MHQIHPNARTTPTAWAEIARATERSGTLARRFGVSAETIRKWRKRGPADCLDHSARRDCRALAAPGCGTSAPHRKVDAHRGCDPTVPVTPLAQGGRSRSRPRLQGAPAGRPRQRAPHTARRHRRSQAAPPSSLPPLTRASESAQRVNSEVFRSVPMRSGRWSVPCGVQPASPWTISPSW
jgi:hypothetical protein